MTVVTFRARLARTGSQMYPEGEQLRDAADVFAPAALAGLAGLRVQRSHDPHAPQVGHVVAGTIGRIDNADPEGRSYVVATLAITDAATAADIRAGRLREISCGYQCAVERDSAGRQHQRNIDFTGGHVALLDSRTERARCGAHCRIGDRQDNMAIQRTTDGGRIDTAAAATCGCSKATQDEIDRAQAWFDIAAERTGVPPHLIVAELTATTAPDADVTRDSILAAAAAVAGRPYSPRGDANEQATFHPGMFAAAPRQDARADLTDDNAFRASLAQRGAAHADGALVNDADLSFSEVLERRASAQFRGGYDPESELEGIAAQQEALGIPVPKGDAAATDIGSDDDAFRARLQARLQTGGAS